MTVAEPVVHRPKPTGYTLALNYLPLVQLLVGAVFITSQATSTEALSFSARE